MGPRPEPYDVLDWSAQVARELGAAAVDMWADLIESLPDLPVDRALGEKEVRDALELEVPDEPMEIDSLLAYLRSVMFECSMYPGHPGFMAYISGPGTIPGAVADLLAAGLNQNAGAWRLSPAATEIELQLARWFAAQFGLPEIAGGMMSSGGAMASFIALKSARDNRAGLDIRQKGVAHSPRLVLYASEEVHTVIDRAADMLGLGTDAVRKIPTDGNYGLRSDLLVTAIERDLAEGLRPFAVVGTAGTVATGSIDPLDEIAEICRRHGLWFHVDGAYGGPAVLAPDLRPLLSGIEAADSIAFDPHKWLYTPHSGGCVLVRDLQHLADAFAVHATYVHEDKERTGRGIDLAMLGPQFSRGFQALKVWVSLLAHGRAAYGRRISHDAELARYLGGLVQERDDFELVTPVSLSICCFRYVPPDLALGDGRDEYLDMLNERIMTEVQLDGRIYYSNAVLQDRFVLRACIVNFRTEAEHVDRLVDVTAEIGARLHAELRSAL